MTPEKTLWQSVLLRAILDATQQDESREKREADTWIRRGGKDFRQVCNMAEIDPDFIRKSYIDGKINSKLLRAASQ